MTLPPMGPPNPWALFGPPLVGIVVGLLLLPVLRHLGRKAAAEREALEAQARHRQDHERPATETS